MYHIRAKYISAVLKPIAAPTDLKNTYVASRLCAPYWEQFPRHNDFVQQAGLIEAKVQFFSSFNYRKCGYSLKRRKKHFTQECFNFKPILGAQTKTRPIVNALTILLRTYVRVRNQPNSLHVTHILRETKFLSNLCAAGKWLRLVFLLSCLPGFKVYVYQLYATWDAEQLRFGS